MEPVVAHLDNPVREYAWGSHEVLARLQGRPVPSGRPEAELWLGAHPSDASTWLIDGRPRPLDAAIAAEPDRLLGPDVRRRFGARLPFLLKVLAVAQPLSLQAHPTEEQARAGFAREQDGGIPVDAPERNYTDPSPKPELIRALTTFHALCGFRRIDATLELWDRLDVPACAWVGDLMRDGGTGAIPTIVAKLLRSPVAERAPMVSSIAAACASTERWGRFAAEARWLRQLALRYPADPGVVVAAMLQLVELAPGQSLYVPSGTLHSYLAGSGVEIMASSDSVVRGGLTAKHVDVPELLNVLDPRPGRSVRVDPVDTATERVHPAPASQFRLSEPRVGGQPVRLDERGGQILFVVDGHAEVTVDGVPTPLSAADSVFVAAAAREVTIDGDATVFRATVGEERPGTSPPQSS